MKTPPEHPESTVHDRRFWPRLLEAVAALATAGARILLVFDPGFLHHAHFVGKGWRGTVRAWASVTAATTAMAAARPAT